ncbi:hypothetical protein D3C77_795250 [compost metagenome]
MKLLEPAFELMLSRFNNMQQVGANKLASKHLSRIALLIGYLLQPAAPVHPAL